VITPDSQSELLTQVDANNQVIGSIERIVAHNNPAVYYRTIFVLVKDNEDKVLLQRRSASKDLYPNCWDLSVGGHVTYGDSYIQTAVKELKEELGIRTQEADLKYKGQVLVKLPASNEFFYVYEYFLQPNDKLKINTQEVKDIQWMAVDEIKQSMKTQSLRWYPRPEQVVNALY
jgi:8-oxo-dGTP diphosphatase